MTPARIPASDPSAVRAAGRGRRGGHGTAIVATLRDEIIAGVLAPDQVLRQEELAARFEVSRMPVRDALRQLEAQGLVVFPPNKGARVAPLSAAELDEIYAMRIAAETLALKQALPRISNSEIDAAAAVNARMACAPVAEFGTLNSAFHMALYTPCAMPRLLAHIETLSAAADRYLRIIVASLDYQETSNAEHDDLVRACRARDEGTALLCLEDHIAKAGRALSARLSERHRP